MLHIEIITPDETVFEGNADSITLPTADGEITVLTNHIPLVSALIPGTIIVRHEGEEHLFAVSRGAVELDGKTVHILADTADRADELQEEAIEKAKAKAEQLMTEKRHDAEGFADAVGMLERELAKLKTVRRRRAGRR